MKNQSLQTTTSTELSTVDPEKLAKWRALSGQRAKSRVSEIKLDQQKLDKEGNLNQNFGKLYAIRYFEDPEAEGGLRADKQEVDFKTARFFSALQRVQPKSKKLDADNKPKFWCREISDANELIELHSTEDKEFLVTGLYRELKEEYMLSWNEVLYVLFEGNVYRWLLSPSQREGVWKLKKDLNKIGAPMWFKLGKTEVVKSEANVFYNVLSFEVAEPIDIDLAINTCEAVNAAISSLFKVLKEKVEVKEAKIEDVPFEDMGKVNEEALPWEA